MVLMDGFDPPSRAYQARVIASIRHEGKWSQRCDSNALDREIPDLQSGATLQRQPLWDGALQEGLRYPMESCPVLIHPQVEHRKGVEPFSRAWKARATAAIPAMRKRVGRVVSRALQDPGLPLERLPLPAVNYVAYSPNMVDPIRFELTASSMPLTRSTEMSYEPESDLR